MSAGWRAFVLAQVGAAPACLNLSAAVWLGLRPTTLSAAGQVLSFLRDDHDDQRPAGPAYTTRRFGYPLRRIGRSICTGTCCCPRVTPSDAS